MYKLYSLSSCFHWIFIYVMWDYFKTNEIDFCIPVSQISIAENKLALKLVFMVVQLQKIQKG